MQVKLILHVQNGPASDQINDPINLTEIQKMGYCRDLPHWVRHIPHRLRGGALLNKLKPSAKRWASICSRREGV